MIGVFCLRRVCWRGGWSAGWGNSVPEPLKVALDLFRQTLLIGRGHGSSRAGQMIRLDRGVGLEPEPTCRAPSSITGAIMLAVFTIVDPAAQQGWLGRTLGLGACSVALYSGFILRSAPRATRSCDCGSSPRAT